MLVIFFINTKQSKMLELKTLDLKLEIIVNLNLKLF